MFCSIIVNGQQSPTEHSHEVVPWWSFTKTVLAAAALTLVRDRLIKLDDLVPGREFSLRQMLKHQAGLADYSELKEYHAAVAGQQTPWPAEEMMQRLDGQRLRYAPGTGWRYSNVGYMLVSNLIEQATGLCIDEALAQRVFSPLGLTRVRLMKSREDLDGVHLESIGSYDPGWVYHGLLVGPVSEAALMLNRLLTADLLPGSLLKQMRDSIALGGPLAGRPWAAPGYGLGLMVGKTHSAHLFLGHTGVGPGSVIAVYHCADGDHEATCAVAGIGAEEGLVEGRAAERLIAALGAIRS
ncbi:D-alanyl-D-alanine carboxypeptidase [Pseudomonas fluorescens]|uniref:serine hydrolase domain-containing protein n=1 Tax=Pseudomonas fluorescens TaxID=294 RepID=UPI00125B6674|nr:serine hydrolase domain-containing protein [Pseudomonas fluorescens]CAG8871035.1 D-alanyl-D-alanine carboxypeptidase [Pseudomonas fluorescens]CAG8871649.1 D-alanyl-D-alanine carboxypeptidase [Pseudomonas fluorescens]VVP69144.1 D-alanyl-D-alanine carboxypeptidase [Pseudomonas fluorescens]